MTRKPVMLIMLMFILALLVACSPTGGEPGAAPGDETPEPTGAVGEIDEETLAAAQQALADQLGLALENIEMLSVEQAEWSDSCLGLGGPDESCAAVVTPGWRVMLEVNGETFEVRTDETGETVRIAGEEPAGEQPPVVEVALQTLAAELGVALENIEVLSFEQQEWSDACLGLGGPDESCAAVITPGWQVMLEVNGETYEVRTDETGETVRVALPETGEPGDDLPSSVTAALQALAEQLGMPVETVEVQDFSQEEWSDACLGLGGPDESCAAVITPGWRVMLEVNGQAYEVRTDQSGEIVRIAGDAAGEGGGDERPGTVEVAVQTLAEQLGVTPETIEVLSFDQQEWSDSCLGLGGPAESCLAVITPGWRVMLQAEGETYEVRTDETGEVVRIADEKSQQPAGEAPAPELDGALLFYQRSGGIAGEIITLRVYADGMVERISGQPENGAPADNVQVEASAVETLMADLEDAGFFDLERSYVPGDTCCDRFLYLISVEQDGEQHTVEALDSTEGTPEAVWDSVEVIESFIAESFGE